MGPLSGLRVVEMVGLGPGPFAGMLLADMGAEVLRVDRVDAARAVDTSRTAINPMNRGKTSIALDLKRPGAVEALLRLVDRAGAFIDVFRPGVAERLGFGPDTCLGRNPKLIYGRLTGWGQEGPYASAAGHDINYIALAGALEPLGRAGQAPTPPINVLGDFAGGGMLLAFGIACAAYEAQASGKGQIVDAAMIDGAALIMAPFYPSRAVGAWGPRGTNQLDTGAPYYEVYECADGGFVSVGAIEPQFYAELMDRLGIEPDDPLRTQQHDRDRWPDQKRRLAELFRTRTRDEWCRSLEYSDACFSPVLTPTEAPSHPHAQARRAFRFIEGIPHPAPAPRFSRTSLDDPRPPTHTGADTEAGLAAWGFTANEIAQLRKEEVIP